VKPKITEDESVTEVETTDSTVVAVGAEGRGDGTAKGQFAYTIEYL
jgi:hypothetical protein